MLTRLLHLRPGEVSPLFRVGAIGLAIAVATALGDDIAQSVFVSRVGSGSIPRMLLFKGLLDVVAAALYLPLTHNRRPRNVWRSAIALYIATVIGTRFLIDGGTDTSAYVLYVGHECAWTILTIHWGVFVLDAFNASQARRLFPILFTASRLGGIVAGAFLVGLAEQFGAINLLFVAAGFAAIAGALSYVAPRDKPVEEDEEDEEPVPGRTPRNPEQPGPWGRWKRASRSPLVRAIAFSTAAMVVVRFGLYLVSIDTINEQFQQKEDSIAAFLGWYSAVANGAGVVLGVFVVPRLLTRVGVGFVNVGYAVVTLFGFAALLGLPGLAAAITARFIHQQLKEAAKTPLSALFYGAEPPDQRASARAFIFGLVIPAATLLTAAMFEASQHLANGLIWIALIGLAGSVLFVIASALQNRRWRSGLQELLQWKLARSPAGPAQAVQSTHAALMSATGGSSTNGPLLADIARGLEAANPRIRALAEELLAETIPRENARRWIRERRTR